MKTQLNAYSKFFANLSKRLGVTNSWQRAFTGTRGMMGYLNRVPIILLGRSGRTWVLGSLAFARFALRLKRHSGLKGLAITLKVSQVILVKKLSGSPIKGCASSLGHRVRMTRSGLPQWFPSGVRVQILKGDLRVARVWLTFCNLYRILDYLGKPKLSTITKPGQHFDAMPYFDFVPVFIHKLNARGWIPDSKLQWEPRLITKSGPGAVSADSRRQPPIRAHNSTGAMIFQAIALTSTQHKELWSVFKRLASLWGQDSLVNRIEEVAKWSAPIKRLASWAPSYLGKLGIKEEPGKVRVFAIVDWWTQMLLRPIHKFIFSILKRIPQDATFDQERGVLAGVELLKKTGYAGSYDLSAATDRLPVLLQSRLVDAFYPGTGQLWAELLVGRSYAVPSGLRKLGMKLPKALTYAVGQPMGALSSWAMLALTHHFIVQFAARSCGCKGWFELYLVLGDDIVIFDRKVAAKYLDVMEDLGVGINLVKSVVSSDSFEFAKRFYSKGVNLSPISFKEMDLAGASLEGAILLFQKFAPDRARIAPFIRFRGYGYRTLGSLTKRLVDIPRHLRFLIVFLSMPGMSGISWARYVDWFGMTSLGRTRTPNPHSLYDSIMLFWRKSLPEGWIPSIRRSLDSQHSRDIWGDMGLERIRDWRVEYLESTLQAIMWPQQLAYLASHEEADRVRLGVHNCIPSVGDLEGLELFIQAFLEWDAKNSLTPTQISIWEYRNTDPQKKRVSRWLRWWSATRSSTQS